MQLQRTEKARLELQPGHRSLSQKQRSVLLLADGRKSLLDLQPLFDGEAEQIALGLIREGYLEVRGAVAARAAAEAPPAAADTFEGRRSLATTRMFLFDLCERMFARRDPALAQRFREALRAAKDRETMLDAGRGMLAEIERIAGPERADSISERIAMLLPPETETA